MNTCAQANCRHCGSSDLRWVAALLAIWDGALLRCGACHQLSLVPTIVPAE